MYDISYLLHYVLSTKTHHLHLNNILAINYVTYTSVSTLFLRIVIMTDTMYMLEYNGRSYVIMTFIVANRLLFLTLRRVIDMIVNRQ